MYMRPSSWSHRWRVLAAGAIVAGMAGLVPMLAAAPAQAATSLQVWLTTANGSSAEDVKPFETLSQPDLMSASGVGSLIHATVGSFGGTGRRWRNLAGLAA